MTAATVAPTVIGLSGGCHAASTFVSLGCASPREARRWTVSPASTRIEVQPDIGDGWAVTRDRIVEGCFSDREAANDYASNCARRARRAGMAVELLVASPAPPCVAGRAAARPVSADPG